MNNKATETNMDMVALDTGVSTHINVTDVISGMVGMLKTLAASLGQKGS